MRHVWAVLAAIVIVAGLTLGPMATPALAATRPNIVLIYVDDFSAYPAWLWTDPKRTPQMAKLFDQGVRFTHAVSSTPRCTPARATLLTGKYGHRIGVTGKDPSAFKPAKGINVKLQKAGYNTKFVGKYFNRIRQLAPTRQAMEKYTQGWHAFDIIWEDAASFYDYRWYSKGATRRYGTKSAHHSSQVTALRAAELIRKTPRSKPLFMVVSLYDGHGPWKPMPRFEGHEKCADVQRYKPPSFNEADVSDKPRYVRQKPRLSSKSWDMTYRCEAALTIDWVTGKVRAALRDTGRLDDTLLVFTSDNGFMKGEHRLRKKNVPYSTPVPLAMSWPARFGSPGRVVDEPVSNVDLAPTFCAVAGCSTPNADGRSILSLATGARDHLGRDFVYTEMLHKITGYRTPAWYGLRTTGRYSDTPWVYTEYQTGERELYDLAADPWELQNLAGKAAYAGVEKELRQMLRRRVVKPDGVEFLGVAR